jgi:hypothetical protein
MGRNAALQRIKDLALNNNAMIKKMKVMVSGANDRV